MKTLIRHAQVVLPESTERINVLIENGKVAALDVPDGASADEVIDASGLHLIPGVVDDQVHFREPGLTHKAEIATESAAAVAGGVTTFMEMPNTRPATLTQALLEEKYQRASVASYANYSFFMGTSHDNYDEIMRTDHSQVCG
ncbi:MAG: dihydroorotase, partial [Planctomyces sp.]